MQSLVYTGRKCLRHDDFARRPQWWYWIYFFMLPVSKQQCEFMKTCVVIVTLRIWDIQNLKNHGKLFHCYWNSSNVIKSIPHIIHLVHNCIGHSTRQCIWRVHSSIHQEGLWPCVNSCKVEEAQFCCWPFCKLTGEVEKCTTLEFWISVIVTESGSAW